MLDGREVTEAAFDPEFVRNDIDIAIAIKQVHIRHIRISIIVRA